MNIQQLEYIIAVDTFRHFAKAAEYCHITQPTLSMMIQKFEEDLNVQIFDRTQHPVVPTAIGSQIIDQARISLKHFGQIKELVEQEQQLSVGKFTLGIIPTIASYIVPVLLSRQQDKSKKITLTLKENTSAYLIRNVLNGTLDGALMAGPLHHAGLTEYPVYYEKFYAYVSPKDKAYKLKKIDLQKLDINNVWLLENEHCLRGQIEHLCQMKRQSATSNTVQYASGSIDTLVHIVDYNNGITIIPEMHAMGMSEEQQEHLREFKNTIAVREVSLVVSKEYIRKTMINNLIMLIKGVVPKSMQDDSLKQYVVNL
ncbi:MAG: hydrogen peroxide-inducible genes activator [Prevotellaceae bacterium]|jgi:LysR family hydrogen peroxide-inducible transcriptional activator|nr:hydrogen peroxide-inducible genes activator [Prevotellaceae bacterium]